MAKRARLEVEKPKNSYFTSSKSNISFVSTGCAVLDCALGGGLALGRTANLVGDRSTAKTGTATEVLINFIRQYPKGTAAYRETEAAFDNDYAEAMGLQIDKVDFGDPDRPLETIEDFIKDFDSFLDKQLKAKQPGLYVLDSLDALSDEEEMSNSIDKGTYGMAKAKKLSIMFRKSTRKQEEAKVLLLIVSQVRDNINAMAFGEKHRRSGGRALDFYASQVFWLANLGKLKRTINKIERPYGIKLRASVKKNKVGLPFREVDFNFIFGFGTDDHGASLEFLKDVGRLDALDQTEAAFKSYLRETSELDDIEYEKERVRAAAAVTAVWAEVEEEFIPKRRKYDQGA